MVVESVTQDDRSSKSKGFVEPQIACTQRVFIGTKERSLEGRREGKKIIWEDLPPFLPTVRKHFQKARKNDALL